ncbi:phytoene desaturase family protein [Candidatus Solincola sp.]|nr:NAD(P)/FAD-dependent oxidoreductase [Actinomycetota bacterium]MDI7251257.1 NAD(P)/FAD-dependent oxidoreductase [Actinomycetota bacterium]
MADYDVVVIGAGCGGVSAGAVLAGQGRKVLVLEQSDLVGGCCSTFEREGFRFDLGASIVEVISPIEEAFRRLGTTFQQEVDLIPCDPVYACVLRDGTKVTIPRSLEGTEEALSRLSEADGKNYQKFAGRMGGFLAETRKGFFTSPMNGFGDLLRVFARTPGLLKYRELFTGSYQGVLSRYFKDSRVLETMSFQAWYVGLPPELAPGVFAILGYSEHEGVWYPRGGMVSIPGALARCGKERGMELRLGAAAKRVLVSGGRVRGVVLEDGTEITCHAVVSDINARTLYLDLVGEEHLPPLVRYGIRSYQPSISAIMLCLGVDYEPPLNAHHTIITAPLEEMNDYWWNSCLRGLLPREQFGLVCWPTMSDPSLAPEGHHVLNVILMGPYRLERTDWDREKRGFLEEAVAWLSRKAVPGLEEHVKVAEILTPLDYERRLRNPGGAIYGLQQDLSAQIVFRPRSRSRAVKGLYLAGASTHPGGGVPTTIGSGIIAADLVDRYE